MQLFPPGDGRQQRRRALNRLLDGEELAAASREFTGPGRRLEPEPVRLDLPIVADLGWIFVVARSQEHVAARDHDPRRDGPAAEPRTAFDHLVAGQHGLPCAACVRIYSPRYLSNTARWRRT